MQRMRAQTLSMGEMKNSREVKNDPCMSTGFTATVPKKRNYFGQQDSSSFDYSSAPQPLPLSSMEIVASMDVSYPNSARSVSPPSSYTTPSCAATPTFSPLPGFPSGHISSFLDSILQDQGLKFAEDGCSILDSTEDLNLPAWINGGSSTPFYIASPTSSGSGKEDGSISGSHYSPVMSPLDGSQRMSPPHRGKERKKKMFEMEPCSDEEQEKRRVNAINAKKNRDMKKRELMDQKKKVESLQQVNQRCGQALKKTQSVIHELGLEVQQLKDTLATRDAEIKAKNLEIRRQREEMALLKGHLDIIAGSLEENNPAKSLLTSLLKKIPNSSTSPYGP